MGFVLWCGFKSPPRGSGCGQVYGKEQEGERVAVGKTVAEVTIDKVYGGKQQ